MTHLGVCLEGPVPRSGSIGVEQRRVRKLERLHVLVCCVEDRVGARLIAGEAEGVRVIGGDDDQRLFVIDERLGRSDGGIQCQYIE